VAALLLGLLVLGVALLFLAFAGTTAEDPGINGSMARLVTRP